MILTHRTLTIFAAGALVLASSACTTSTCSRTADFSTVKLGEVDGVRLFAPDGGPAPDSDGGDPGTAEGGEAGITADQGPLPRDATGIKDGNMYYSSAFGGPYAYYPPFRTITFVHDLGVIPLMQFFLAFTADGTLAQSAGNMTELPQSQDGGSNAVNEKTITVYNNTCSEFYLWVEAYGRNP